MSLTINLPDKVLAGLYQSYTLESSEGPPSGKVLVDGVEIEHRIIPLGPPKTYTGEAPDTYKYKVTFYLPEDSVGKRLELRFQAGSSRVEESHEILAE